MLSAHTLTVVHDDDTRTEYTDVRYALDRHGVRVHTSHGEVCFTDVLTVLATVRRAPAVADAR
jgi:hypothetical protein